MTDYPTPTLGRIRIPEPYGESSIRVTLAAGRIRIMFDSRMIAHMQIAAGFAGERGAFGDYMSGYAQMPIGQRS